jgi:FKBP-type peptidyl-prolyl cis-trans isomerase FkpA
MKNLITFTTLLVVLLVSACQQQSGGAKSVKLENDTDKTFYAVGAMFGSRLNSLGLSDQELNAIMMGLSESATGKESKVALQEYRPKIQALFKERMSKKSETSKKDGVAFLEKFVKSEGAQKTKSGLAYKVLKKGTGKKPKATDTVEVHYHGTLIDGTVFDSSVERKKTVSFPLNRVIKGWTEGLQLLETGGKIKLVIPAELAYGDNGAPPKIPGGSTLVFEVELFSIKDPKKPGPSAKAAKKPAKTKKVATKK